MPLGIATGVGIAQLGMGIAGSIKSSRADKRARRAAREAGRLNAENIRAETAETIRRTQLQNEALIGTATASMGGAGVRGGTGTPAAYLSSTMAEQQRQLDWTQTSSDLRANLAEKTGQQVSDQIGMQSSFNRLQTYTGAALGLGNMYTQGLFTPAEKEGYGGYSPDNYTGGGGYNPYQPLGGGTAS